MSSMLTQYKQMSTHLIIVACSSQLFFFADTVHCMCVARSTH